MIHKSFSKYSRDYYGGCLIILIGLATVFEGRTYQIGTVSQMGAGFFPVALGVIMMLTGLAIVITAEKPAREAQAESAPIEWRGPLCIIVANIAFVVLGRYGGLLPATFAIVFLSALGDRQNSLKSAFLLALAMTVVCLVIFYWALQLQFPLFRWG